eukprot:TRINITY_DN19007_c0_g2_i1.p1 TRINITY_DN19007_c0_g2~~TRINITY_DN19007_c0_g2_i1.p1  ORF type:complete len:437 (+),score=137.25 TRINITY_DN19007_c0_g2_i1:46-1311(+)
MLRSLVGSEMCIRDRYQRRVRGTRPLDIAHCGHLSRPGRMRAVAPGTIPPMNKSLTPNPTSGDNEGDGQGSWSRLAICFAGLQVSYLTWGYLQEKVMTKQYGDPPGEKFPSAMFCVLMNRVFAIGMAVAMLSLTRPAHSPNHGWLDLPQGVSLTEFAAPSISNTISSFGQYQALRYVSFPLQTIAKSTKVIPVMLMGKFLNNKTYGQREYIEAAVISAGVIVFAMEGKWEGLVTGAGGLEMPSYHVLLGCLMLLLYVGADSFTSQYQSKLFKAHESVTQFHMMFLVNLWAATLSLLSLVGSGQLMSTLGFLAIHPEAFIDNMVIGVTSATGQCFIFYTIKTFGPVTFTLIMTTRQLFSITISAITFGHSVSLAMLVGGTMVFTTLFVRMHRNWKKQQAAALQLPDPCTSRTTHPHGPQPNA